MFRIWMRGHTWSRVQNTLPVSNKPRDVSNTTPTVSNTPRDQARDQLMEEKDAALSSRDDIQSHAFHLTGGFCAIWCL